MKYTRPVTSPRPRRIAHALLLPAAVIGCAAEPAPGTDPAREDDGRVALGTTSLDSRDFDGRAAHNAGLDLAPALARPRLTGRFAAPHIAATFDPATGVTRTLMAHAGFLTGPAAAPASPHELALDFVRRNPDLLGVRAADLADLEITDTVYSRPTGVTHLYYRQRHLGLPVYNGQLHVNVTADGRILSINNSLMPDLAGVARSTRPVIGADQAVASVAANLSVGLAAAPVVVAAAQAQDVAQRTRVEAPDLARGPIDAALMWLPINARHAALVWRFEVATVDRNHHFDYTVDATTGRVWTRADWIAAASYRAYPRPVESPGHTTPAIPADARTVIVNPADPVASPLGWHDTGTTAYTIHRGNNVHAYDDRDGNDAPPATQPACSATLDCDFPLNLSSHPVGYTSAAITNLFYWTNLVHDIQYAYGFDEAAGNFQVNNFGHGGAGNDAVLAEAQDSFLTNSSRFLTPPDGQAPRMEMYEWNATWPMRDSDLDNGLVVHEYAHGVSRRLVGGPSNVSCLTTVQNPSEGWSDWFALWYMAEPADVSTDFRGLGTYVLGQSWGGVGLRPARYTTHPAVNNWTYASLSGMTTPSGGPHTANIGAVWAQALWEVYWALVAVHGFDANVRDALGTGGNQRAMLYVTEGMKNTVCQPNFLDARDGIIAAATAAHGGQDVCTIWRAFAAYGLGTNASAGGGGINVTNGFAVPASCP